MSLWPDSYVRGDSYKELTYIYIYIYIYMEEFI